VAFALTTLVALAVGASIVFATRGWSQHQARVRTQQQLRSAIAALSREVRLAGVCISLGSRGNPPGDFRPIDGVDNGTTDAVTVRANPRCVSASLPGTTTDATGTYTDCTIGCTSLTVDNAAGFLANTWAYVYGDAINHARFRIASVAGNTLNVDTAGGRGPVIGRFPDQSPVFQFEERTFRIDSTCPNGCDGATPALTLQTLDAPETALVQGVDRLDLHYILNRVYDAGTCDAGTGGSINLCVVPLPASSTDWTQVRVVTFDLGVRSLTRVPGSGGDGYLRFGEVFEITPRNAVFANGTRL
jgi:hypothetical protein